MHGTSWQEFAFGLAKKRNRRLASTVICFNPGQPPSIRIAARGQGKPGPASRVKLIDLMALRRSGVMEPKYLIMCSAERNEKTLFL